MEATFLLIALIIYGISLGLFLLKNDLWAGIMLIIAVLIHLGGLMARSIIAQHPPFTNMYETFILLPFLVAIRMVFWKEQLGKQFRKILTVSVMAIIFIALMLPESLKTPKPLMPALNSIWMYIHVPSYFLGYMAMLVAAVYAVLLLVQKENNGASNAIIKRMDNEVKIAFFFLTIGMVTGGIWAYVSWGNYWAWDPKETWALINIIVLSFYFHLNTTTKQKKAVIVLFTFLTIAFTYWGVSFILSGLHSYT
ncbi:cytochrome c biogenesis protein CcsA [bacterium]|nr:cytochrome c biogenesis protein CcsA [bacterium]MBU1874103.1 cytochrome c biogenesis protein CcsA [bacterium]